MLVCQCDRTFILTTRTNSGVLLRNETDPGTEVINYQCPPAIDVVVYLDFIVRIGSALK